MSHIQLSQHSQIAKGQQGAVLIVVLLFLVLIILVGVIAVRQSTTDLKLATSDQINTLLLQSADNANQSIEQSINGSSDADIYKDMISRTGPFGHFVLDTNNTKNEYIFCFRPRINFFDINKTTITTPSGGSVFSNNNGYCDPSVSGDYISSRNTSMTQVSLSLTPINAAHENFSNYIAGQDTSERASKAFMFDINSTAILPVYASATKKAKDCLKKSSLLKDDTSKETIVDCLAEANVPSNMVYERVNIKNKSYSNKCVEMGKGAGNTQRAICTLIPNGSPPTSER